MSKLNVLKRKFEEAVKILKNICKFNVVGEIPWVCNMAYEGKRVPGIISYFEL